jgi:hypothetical protein
MTPLRLRRVLSLLLLAVLACGCASPSEDDSASSDGALSGSPTEERARQDDANEKAFLGYLDQAYGKAELAAFASLPDGKGLLGEGQTDYATLARNCAGRSGFTVSAQRWGATDIPDVIPGGFSLRDRSLFTIDAFDGQTKTTLAVAVYDEKGTFFFGRKRTPAGGYTTDRGAAFHATLLVCK